MTAIVKWRQGKNSLALDALHAPTIADVRRAITTVRELKDTLEA